MQKSLWDDLPVQFKEVEVNSLTKTCKDCGIEQHLGNFDTQYFRSDGSKSHRNTCRICKKNCVEGIPRVNDHLMCPTGFDNINSPICMSCGENNPDEYHTAFRKQFWNKH